MYKGHAADGPNMSLDNIFSCLGQIIFFFHNKHDINIKNTVTASVISKKRGK